MWDVDKTGLMQAAWQSHMTFRVYQRQTQPLALSILDSGPDATSIDIGNWTAIVVPRPTSTMAKRGHSWVARTLPGQTPLLQGQLTGLFVGTVAD